MIGDQRVVAIVRIAARHELARRQHQRHDHADREPSDHRLYCRLAARRGQPPRSIGVGGNVCAGGAPGRSNRTAIRRRCRARARRSHRCFPRRSRRADLVGGRRGAGHGVRADRRPAAVDRPARQRARRGHVPLRAGRRRLAAQGRSRRLRLSRPRRVARAEARAAAARRRAADLRGSATTCSTRSRATRRCSPISCRTTCARRSPGSATSTSRPSIGTRCTRRAFRSSARSSSSSSRCPRSCSSAAACSGCSSSGSRRSGASLGGGIGLALVLSAAAFALIHLPKDGDPRALATFFPGLLFGWMRSATGSIVASTVSHAGSNILIRILDHSL